MRRKLAVILGLGTALAIGLAAIAAAVKPVQIPIPVLTLKMNSAVTPRELPKHSMSPVALRLQGRIYDIDGTQPAALAEMRNYFDKNGAINATGLPVCGRREIESRNAMNARRVCRKSIVGTGMAHIALSSSLEPKPIPVRLTFFNGGIRGHTTRLLIHAVIATPRPAPLVAVIKVQSHHLRRYGWRAVTRIPRIAHGSGSVLDFRFKIRRFFTYKGTKRSYLAARCLDDALFMAVRASFPHGLILQGTVIRPCSASG